jgi:hypothetical protein
MFSVIVLCSCNAAKQASFTPQPGPIPIAEKWVITVADSPTAPTGWTFTSQTLNTQTTPTGPCATDFANLTNPNTMPLPASFGSCAVSTNIQLPAGQSNWLQTIDMGAITAILRPNDGDSVYYVLQYDMADGSTSVTLGGSGTFTATTTVANGTTKFNYQISGPLNCLTINNAITAACTDWHTTFTATLAN